MQVNQWMSVEMTILHENGDGRNEAEGICIKIELHQHIPDSESITRSDLTKRMRMSVGYIASCSLSVYI